MAQEPLEPGVVNGTFAYAEKSVYAGETVSLRVSSDTPYRMTVVRLGPNTDQPSETTDVPLADYPLQDFPALQQPITPGSYINIEQQLPPQDVLKALTLECWVRPWIATANWQGLISQYTYKGACGVGLFIDDKGCINFYAGDGGEFNLAYMYPNAAPLTLLAWHHIVGVWDGSSNTASLWIDGVLSGSWQPQTAGFELKPGSAPLRLGAYGDDQDSLSPYTKYCLDGDLAMPVIYNYALTSDEIKQRYSEQGLKTPSLDGLLGCWPMTEEKGDRLADISSYERDGQIINHATWMIGGPSFSGISVAQFQTPPYDPATDPNRGHGLRFASDDLFDCGWDITKIYTIPADAKPGIYSGRILYGGNFASVYDVSFVVKKPQGTKSDILVLCATNTWFAYNQTPFQDPAEPAIVFQSGARVSRSRDADTVESADAVEQIVPQFCFYMNHHGVAAGQPTYFVGLNLPCPAADPYALFVAPDVTPTGPTVNYSHLVRAERFLHLWLENNNYDFDLATDLDLHSDPHLLDNCRVLIINGHSEYWSVPAYENVQTFLNNQGRVAVLSGNTMFWRVSFDPSGAVMECRKVPSDSLDLIGGRQGATFGEMWHSDDGLRGGVMRDANYPAYPLIGLECAGWFDPPAYPGNFSAYQCMNPDAPLFNTPQPTGLKQGDSFGYISQPGLAVKSGVVGHEYDIRISNPQMGLGTPPQGAPVPSEPPNIQTLAQALISTTISAQPPNTVFDYYLNWYGVPPPFPLLTAEMIYWERPEGGQVFHAGAIGSGWALSQDRVMQTLMSNVLSLFGVKSHS